jgi:hypothetical protein
VDEARVHFERGVELYREGSFDAALVEFQRSYELAPNYKILYNLAQVQAERHEYVAAVKLLNEYLQSGGAAVAAERRQAVAQDLEKLSQRIATLTVDVNVTDAEVFVNDVSVGRSPLTAPVLVNVGTCRVRAEKPGFVTQSRPVTIVGADRPHVELKLEPVPVTAQRSAQDRVLKTRNMTPFWISLGATVVLGGTTGVFGALALGANHDLDQALDHYPLQQSSVDSTRRKLRTMAALTDGFGGATLVAACAAVYFFVSPPEHTEAAPTSGLHATVAPTLSGVSVSGTF